MFLKLYVLSLTLLNSLGLLKSRKKNVKLIFFLYLQKIYISIFALKFGGLSLVEALGDDLSGLSLGLALTVIGGENVISLCKNNCPGHFNKGQDLDKVLRCCSLVSPLKILPCGFFSHRMKVYFFS